MEGRGRRHGVAPAGRAEEPAHRLALPVVQARRELAESGHAAVAGQPRRDHDRQTPGQTAASAPRLAEVGNRLKMIAQAAQFRHRHRRRLRADPPLGRLPAAPPRLPGARRQLAHMHLLRPPVLAPARRPARQAREPARQPQHPPVRRPAAHAREPRRVHERLRDKNRTAVRRAHVPRQPAQAQTQHPGGQVGHLPPGPASTTKRLLLAINPSRRNCRSGGQPIQRSRAPTLNAPAVQPASATQEDP